MSRIALITVAALAAIAAVAAGLNYSTSSDAGAAPADDNVARVHKTPWCGCCDDWVTHLQEDGFEVTVVEHEDLTPIKDFLGVPRPLGSCHTAEIGGYAIEGHVPAADIRRLLLERPEGVRGLAVPGMPVGSPGMEMGDRRDPYDVVAFGDAGTSVFTEYRP
ncbi:MAG: DUF411 domain-containing protein [Pseudomonadales bacterium]